MSGRDRDLDLDLDIDVGEILSDTTTQKTVAFGLMMLLLGYGMGLRNGGRTAYKAGGPYVDGQPEWVGAMQRLSLWVFAGAGLCLLAYLWLDYKQVGDES
jgi:hypothetical protein